MSQPMPTPVPAAPAAVPVPVRPSPVPVPAARGGPPGPGWAAGPPPLAALQDRVVAYLVDLASLTLLSPLVFLFQQVAGGVVSLGFLLLAVPVAAVTGEEELAPLVASVAALAVSVGWAVALSVALSAVVFWLVPAKAHGQTLGKMLARVRVVRRDYRRVTAAGHGRRWLALQVDGAFYGLVGLLLVLNRRPPQRLGDLWADTIVVRA